MLTTDLTEAEQWEQINYPSFDQAMYDKILAVKAAMASVDAHAPTVSSQLNNVPFDFTEFGHDITIHVGVKDGGAPFYTLLIPTQWLGA